MMPCHHNLEEYLVAYHLDGTGLRNDPKGPLFRTIGRRTRDSAAGEPSPSGKPPPLRRGVG